MIIAGNFKANHNKAITADYLQQLSSFIAQEQIEDDVYIFPPFTALPEEKTQGVKVGAQNGYPAEKGSYTGEICLDQLSSLGIDTILIGHSERRHVIKESQSFIARKYDFYKRHNFTIVYCVGEPIEVRQKGIESVMSYIEEQFEGIDLDYQHLIIAYEPVWAIGTGMSATVEDIEEVHQSIRQSVECPILYGGSVTMGNAKSILESAYVDGVLIGGFSLVAADLCKILSLSQEIQK